MHEEVVLVVDVGSSSVKVGYSGEDVPSHIFPSTIAKPTVRNIEVLLCASYTATWP